MKTFFFSIFARPNYAIGIVSHYCAEVRADNYEAALLKLYDTYEHVTVCFYRE